MQLYELADLAAGDSTSTEQLLRQLKVVASRTKLPPLASWVEHELSGYPPDVELPNYRGPFETPVLGQYSGPMGSGAVNVPIPPLAFVDGVRGGQLFNVVFTEGVAVLEELAAHTDQTFRIPWPADAIAAVHHLLRDRAQLGNGYDVLVGAAKIMSRHVVAGILSTVRNRVLDLALELEQIHPDVALPAEPAERRHAVQVVNAIVYGNAAIGSEQFTQLTSLTVPETQDELLGRLAGLGVSEPDRAELVTAIDEDAAGGKRRLGKKVGAWIAGHANTAVDAGAKEAGSQGAGVAGAFIGQLIRGFLTGGLG